MYVTEDKLVAIREILKRNNSRFNEDCEEMRKLVRNTKLPKKRYGQLYINKDNIRQRTLDAEVARSFERCRKINFPKGELKRTSSQLIHIVQKWMINFNWMQGFNVGKVLLTNGSIYAWFYPD